MAQNDTGLPALIPGEGVRTVQSGAASDPASPPLTSNGGACVLYAQRLRENPPSGGPPASTDGPAIGAARKSYLSTQWSGDHDRRPAPGLLARTRV